MQCHSSPIRQVPSLSLSVSQSSKIKQRSLFPLINKPSINNHANGIASPTKVSAYIGLKTAPQNLLLFKETVQWSRKTVSNGTWNPINNKKFETFTYLPPLSDESIRKEIDYMLSKGWVPCLEFDELGYVHRTNSRRPGYYDGRFWTLWKLPMFGCTDSSQVLQEIKDCMETFPTAFIRCIAFDSAHQGQCMAFLIHKP